jgi:hypothetical protein
MNDRELLELAAKAAGMSITPNWSYADGLIADGELWNPLTDDGDALRLAVKLGIEPRQTPEMASALWSIDTPPGFAVRNEMRNGDPYAATRRAITRAAAEIGKGMK